MRELTQAGESSQSDGPPPQNNETGGHSSAIPH